jgi:hypothetical protein
MKPWDVKPLSKICMEKIKMWLCHVTKNKHGDECMQNLKEKEDFGSKKGLGGPNLCLFEQKLS